MIFLVQNDDFNELLSIYNSYFIPTNLVISNDPNKIKEENKLENLENINIVEQKDLYYRKKLLDKIDGACVIMYINDEKIF